MRSEKINSTIKGIQNEIDHFLGLVAHRHLWTHERIIQLQNDINFGNDVFKRLPLWARQRVVGYWEAVYKRHERKLVWTHVIRGHRLPYTDPSITETPKEISELETRSDFAYLTKINGRLVAVPFSEESRLKDIETRILTQSEIDHIIQPNRSNIHLLVPNYERDEIIKMTSGLVK